VLKRKKEKRSSNLDDIILESLVFIYVSISVGDEGINGAGQIQYVEKDLSSLEYGDLFA